MFSTREIMGLAVKLERNGERFYRDATGMFSEPRLTALLQWLADEELRHMEWFSAKQPQLEPGQVEREIQEIGDELLREILGDQTFSLQEVDLSSIRDSDALLDVAIEFENDTILFYEILHGFVEDKETTEGLIEIVAEERSHIESLQAIRSSIASQTKQQG